MGRLVLLALLAVAAFAWRQEHDARVRAEDSVKAASVATQADTRSFNRLQTSCTQRVDDARKAGAALARITHASPSSAPAPDGLVDVGDLRALFGQSSPGVPGQPESGLAAGASAP